MALQLEVISGRSLTIRGCKKLIRKVQRQNATTHSYTIHVTLRADGTIMDKLPIVLYLPAGEPKKLKMEVEQYHNLHVYSSKSGRLSDYDKVNFSFQVGWTSLLRFLGWK